MSQLIELLNEQMEQGKPVNLIGAHGMTGNFAKLLAAAETKNDLKGKIILKWDISRSLTRMIIADVEARLPRYTHPRYGKVPPPKLIELAKETDQLQTLELAVFTQVRRRISSGIDAMISMNVTADTLKSEAFAEFLRRDPVEKGRYCIEVTEQNTPLLNEAMRQRLKAFKDLGYSLAVDDFSMGKHIFEVFAEQSVRYRQAGRQSGQKRAEECEEASGSSIHSLYLAKSMNFTVLAGIRGKRSGSAIC